ncbi:glycosyltransferase [Anaerocolumna sp. AGMB13025]|uniref:glycosyltransferase n=1 Tax=Anaerocolumna sp. AGMB13025 TaxID=3039116 RepID=UPI00241F2123|nr:glycosyltransferase [Anaerocolumna sp. AGMB13025]WFR58276.1 glycosyltransferase [Anaerocolumna sp. AGMB13025]
MKILLYSGHLRLVEKSGVGRAIYHQQEALKVNEVSYTTDKKEEYDIIHINTIFLSSFFMALVAKAKGKKIVYHAHSTEEDFKNSFLCSNLLAPLYKKWIMKCYNSGDLIVTPTLYSKNLLEGYGLKKPIVSISNGIDLEYYKRNEGDRSKFREKYHLREEDKVVISAGLYIERKGILDFVELAKAMPDYKFIWFGYTNLNTVSIRVKKAVKTKLPNLFFPGYVCREELREAYAGSDLFLFLTHEETEGIVLLEALAMKTPVLIRDIPIYEESLVDGRDVYKGKNLSQFQHNIQGIINGEFPSLVEPGYKVVNERSIKAVGAQLKEEYAKMMKRKEKTETKVKRIYLTQNNL